jgi:hypothetical protein
MVIGSRRRIRWDGREWLGGTLGWEGERRRGASASTVETDEVTDVGKHVGLLGDHLLESYDPTSNTDETSSANRPDQTKEAVPNAPRL